MWMDRLNTKEKARTECAIEDLSTISWAQPLLSRLSNSGGISSENMPLMFEVRFAHELHLAGVTAEYEYHGGVGGSTIEFRLNTTPTWLIELVSVRPSDATKRATQKIGEIYEQLLVPTSDDPGRSEPGEMITVQQKIGEKVFSGGAPTKFPPLDGSLRMILTDIRGYLDQGGDCYDYRQMAYGPSGIPAQYSWARSYWLGGSVIGLFDERNPLRAAPYIQERIHFLGFVRENDFLKTEITDSGYYLANWNLFSDEQEARHAFKSFPLHSRQRA